VSFHGFPWWDPSNDAKKGLTHFVPHRRLNIGVCLPSQDNFPGLADADVEAEVAFSLKKILPSPLCLKYQLEAKAKVRNTHLLVNVDSGRAVAT
jgi:hypothetical protein